MEVLSSHSIASSSRIVNPCIPWGGQWIGQWRITWSTICSSVPHSQAAEGAIAHLRKLERRPLTPVRRRLSGIHAVLGRVISGGGLATSGMKVRSLVVFSNRSAFHRWSAQGAASPLSSLSRGLTDELSCCAAGTNGFLDLKGRAFALGGQVSAE